jgi:hypothetical protein
MVEWHGGAELLTSGQLETERKTDMKGPGKVTPFKDSAPSDLLPPTRPHFLIIAHW